MSVSPAELEEHHQPEPAEDSLPDGWALSHLGEVTTPSKEKVEPHVLPDARYLSLGHVESNTNRIVGNGHARDVKSTKSVFRKGDVIYGKLRPYLNKVAMPGFDGICSTDFLVFPKKSGLESQLLLWFLTLPKVVEYANHHSSGIELPRVKFDALAQLDFPLPPLAEQKRFVAKVEELLARVNAAREHLAKVPQILKTLRQSVLAAACSGRLTEDWREEQLEAVSTDVFLEELDRKVVAQRRREESETLADPLELGEIPSTWRWVSLKSVTKRIGDVDHKMPKQVENGLPYVSTKDFVDNGIDLKGAKRISEESYEALSKKIRPVCGDLLLSRYGTVGEVRLVEHKGVFQASYSIAIIKTFNSPDLSKYLLLALRSQVLQRQMDAAIRASSQPDLGLRHIRGLLIPLPPAQEQHEIVRRVEALFQLADTIEKRVAAATKRADKLTQSILAKAFRGELVPTEAELARRAGRPYEPASALLQRIQAERKPQGRASRSKRSGGTRTANRASGNQ